MPTFHCSVLNFFVVAVILAFAVTDKWIKVNEGGCVLIYFWYCIWGSRVVVYGSIANSSFRYFVVEVRFFIQNQKIGLLFTGFFNKISLKENISLEVSLAHCEDFAE